MNATNSRVLWCIIGGDTQPFKVTAPINNDIFQLKELIYEKKKNTCRDINAENLVL
jgi:Crinkler effector protein N-terminal domain